MSTTIYWPAGGKLRARITKDGQLVCIFTHPPTDEQGHAMAGALDADQSAADDATDRENSLRSQLNTEAANHVETLAQLNTLTQLNIKMNKAISIAQRALASANFLIYKHVPDHNWSAYIKRDIDAIKSILAGGDHIEEPLALVELDRAVTGMLKWTAQGALESARWPDGTKFYVAPPSPVELTVWDGAMPESNGKSNFTAILMRKGAPFLDGIMGGITIDRSEYPDRVRYEADRVRFLIGELPDEPDILAYDTDKHSGYTKYCECPPGTDRCITQGGHFPACTACHRRLKP